MDTVTVSYNHSSEAACLWAHCKNTGKFYIARVEPIVGSNGIQLYRRHTACEVHIADGVKFAQGVN